MAKRRATRKYETLLEFLVDYSNSLLKDAIQLPPGSYRGELANEIKLDLSIPEIGRVGPLKAQVVFRDPSGMVAMRLPQMLPEVHEAYAKAQEKAKALVKPFIDTGLAILLDDHEEKIEALQEEWAQEKQGLLDEMQRRIAELEEQTEEKVKLMAAKLAAQQGSSGPVSTVLTRGFPIPDVSSKEAVFSGAIDAGDLTTFLIKAAADSWTGVLQIESGQGSRYGYFDNGGPVGWRSDPIQENEVLGVLLYKAKQITKEQLQQSLEFMEEKGIRQGEAFIQIGIMTFSQMVMVLGKQVEFILQQVRGLKEGSFNFYLLADLPERFVPPKVSTPDLLFKEYVKQAKETSNEDVYRSYAPKLNTYLAFSDLAKSVLGQIGFGKQERRLIEVIQSNSWRMREIFSVSPLSRGGTAAFIWACHHLGFFSYTKLEDESRTLARFTGLFDRKKQQIHGGTLFDLLEVHWICLPQEVEEAFQRMKKSYDPVKNPTMPSSLHTEAAFLLEHITDAHGILKDDKRRRSYRLKLIEKDMILQTAMLLSKKGEMAILRHDRREACACFSKALELIPGNQDYIAGLRRATAIGG
jgi:hypothetical protein